ncbi:MAG: tetratricopeptide repeat protein, partial [Candidatus Eisenbacteria bacterium]|nr:tetratricopeptide repeat protein [Candidatus Eisenbacteria bacterium]
MTDPVVTDPPPPAETSADQRGDADRLLAEARTASARDDHATAIRSYEAAIAIEPALQESVAVSLAAQRTWAGQYDDAIYELHAYVRTHAFDMDARLLLALALSWNDQPQAALETYRAVLVHRPENRDARLGEARMLAWTGRSSEAAACYRALVAEDPGWLDARLGEAQIHNWRGDHRRSERLYRNILDDDPESRDAWLGLATAYRWDGRADRALEALTHAPPDDPGARELAAAIRDDWRPRWDTRYDFARDSDDFETRTATTAGRLPWGQRGHLRFGVADQRYARPGDQDGDELWATAGLDMRGAAT